VENILQYGWPILFVWVFADQAGIPVPVVPLLMGAGALAGGNRLSLSLAIGLAVAASMLADLAWYGVGRRYGLRALGVLCRITLEPDSCVRRAQDIFLRHRLRAFLLAKFLPGVNPLAAGLAGAVGVGVVRFVAYDLGSAVAWAGSWTALGYLLSDVIATALDGASNLGHGAVALLGTALAAYVVIKFVKRRRFLRQLRIARIGPAEVKRQVDAGERTIIVDLRTTLEESADPYTIPGALRMTPEELEQRHLEIPRGVEIVLFCS
jgi:membrane protein DedA with SNARE-associated domain